MPSPCGCRFSLATLLVLLVVLSCCVAILTAVRERSREYDRLITCKSNLKVIASYITFYAQRHTYPPVYPTSFVPGSATGHPLPGGPNGAFWSWTWRPIAGSTIVSRPGADYLFNCPVTRLRETSTMLCYTCPAFQASLPDPGGSGRNIPVYPGQRLSDAVAPDVMIAGDIVGPPDAPNHGGKPGEPNREFFALHFDGHVDTVGPYSAKAKLYQIMTTGIRST